MKKIIYILIAFTLFLAGNIYSQTDSIAKNAKTDTIAKSSKVEYALLIAEYYFGVNIIYENGKKEDLLEKFNLKIKGNWNSEKNFPLQVKFFKYLNEQGFVLVSHTCAIYEHPFDWKYSYIFRKEN